MYCEFYYDWAGEASGEKRVVSGEWRVNSQQNTVSQSDRLAYNGEQLTGNICQIAVLRDVQGLHGGNDVLGDDVVVWRLFFVVAAGHGHQHIQVGK